MEPFLAKGLGGWKAMKLQSRAGLLVTQTGGKGLTSSAVMIAWESPENFFSSSLDEAGKHFSDKLKLAVNNLRGRLMNSE